MKKGFKWLICLLLSISLIQPCSFVHATSKGEQVVALAITHIGQSYVYGAAGPNTFDCSGFAQYIYKQVGVSIPHGTVFFNNGGYSNYGGRRVELDHLQPGDLVFFGYNDNDLTHVAIYVGNGKVVNALNEKYGVCYTYLTQALCRQYGGTVYWNTAYGTTPRFGVRFFEDMDYQDYTGQVESSTNTGNDNVSVGVTNINKIQNNWIDKDSDNTGGDVYMPDINQIPLGEISDVSVDGKWINVTGWALDFDHMSDRLNLKIYLDDSFLGVVATTKDNSWVNTYYQSSDSHGFDVTLLSDSFGTFTLSIYATDPDTEEDILIGSKQVVISQNVSKENDKSVSSGIRYMPFKDVSSSKWYYSYVQDIYDLKLMAGMNTDTFSPSLSMNRAMAATVLYRMAGCPDEEYTDYFSDVSDGKYYSKAITWCYENGIFEGNENGTFEPSKNITRQEFVVILYRFARYLGVDVSCSTDLSHFPDSSEVSEWAKEAMCWAVENKLITGSQGNIDPCNHVTRAQCAKMILTLYNLK